MPATSVIKPQSAKHGNFPSFCSFFSLSETWERVLFATFQYSDPEVLKEPLFLSVKPGYTGPSFYLETVRTAEQTSNYVVRPSALKFSTKRAVPESRQVT
jgi:hypothetical protein